MNRRQLLTLTAGSLIAHNSFAKTTSTKMSAASVQAVSAKSNKSAQSVSTKVTPKQAPAAKSVSKKNATAKNKTAIQAASHQAAPTPTVSRNTILTGNISSTPMQTRLTLESAQRLQFTTFMLANPARLVLDVQDIPINNATLTQLPRRLSAKDAQVRSIRLGKKDAHTTRIVFDLKRPITLHTLTLLPSGSLKHRLQLDLVADANQATNPPQATVPTNTHSKKANKNDDPLRDLIREQEHQKKNVRTQPESPRTDRRTSNDSAHRRTSPPVIVIDPGHGGKDPGATGISGVQEKNVVLSTALYLKRDLETKGYIVHMTRNNDTFVPLTSRRQLPQRVNADLFISVHANSLANSSTMRGADAFVWGRANSERARQLALSENSVAAVEGIPNVGNKDVDMILADMMQSQTTTDSIRLGNLILKNLARRAKVHKKTVDTGNLVVLRAINVPSVLVELGFLSNPEDEKLLASPAFQRQSASAIANAIQQYLQTTSR